MINYTIRQLRKTESFKKLYFNLITNQEMSSIEKTKILTLAIIFLNSKDEFVKEFGYRLILKYCNKYEDYIPLYTVATNMGYTPIVKFIETNHLSGVSKDSFFREFISSFSENFKKENIYLTEEQFQLNLFFDKHNLNNVALVAPTSYGKSELILSLIDKNKESKICILVPTKALLAQTKRRIFKSKFYDISRKIITHPEMYQATDLFFIAVLTQERLLRMLERNKDLVFDFVVVDEAHNILDKDLRARLLASTLIILNHRNNKTSYKFLTPFLLDFNNLSIKYTNIDVHGYKVEESIKSENYFVYDCIADKNLIFYDQYLDYSYKLGNNLFQNDLDLIKSLAGYKNIIYLNRPPHIESFAKKLIKCSQPVENLKILNACKDIANYVHRDYSLIDCLKYGIAYHHGSIPDNIRLYVEHLFSTIPELRFVITSSTLLEGVNIPADKIFILSHKKGLKNLSHAQLKNLVGRVGRFKDIFEAESGSLNKLEAEVYLVKSEYMPSNANLLNYLSKTVKVDRKYKELPENILLEKTPEEDSNLDFIKESDEFLENQVPGITNKTGVRYAKTEIGKLCYKNNITEFDILNSEIFMQKIITNLREEKIIIENTTMLLNLLVLIFIDRIDESDNNRNIIRLKNKNAQNFYRMFLEWKIKQASYKEMIGSFMKYWNNLVKAGEDTIVYVDKWGDTTRENPHNKGTSFRQLWTDISKKQQKEKINLAIVRIKEEQDFIENNLMKYIETMYDLQLIKEQLYYQIKYGTDDTYIITMIKNGIGFHTAKLLKNKYRKYIRTNIKEGTIEFLPKLVDAMKQNNENEIIIFEVNGNMPLQV